MKRRDLVLSVINLCGGQPGFGRTSLQKVCYLAGFALDTETHHHAYYYGPYSQAVEDDVEALAWSDLVIEKARPIGWSSSGKEVTRYEYNVTEDGGDRVSILRQKYPQEFERLDHLIEMLNSSAGTLHQSILAPVTKVLYLQEERGSELTENEIRELAHNLGWKIKANQLKRVEKVLADLRDSDFIPSPSTEGDW